MKKKKKIVQKKHIEKKPDNIRRLYIETDGRKIVVTKNELSQLEVYAVLKQLLENIKW